MREQRPSLFIPARVSRTPDDFPLKGLFSHQARGDLRVSPPVVTAQGLLRAALEEKFSSIPGDLPLCALDTDLKTPSIKNCVAVYLHFP